MKAFFTQPIGQLARQNCIGFIGCNLYLIGNGFGLYEGQMGSIEYLTLLRHLHF